LNITDDDAKEGLIAVETYIKEHFDAHPELLDSKKVVFHHVLVPSKKADKPPQVKPRANFKSNKKPLFAHTGFVDPDELKYEPGAYQGHEFKAMLHVKGMLITIDEKGQSKVVPSIELKRVHVYERESAPAKEFSDDEDDE
jgi:hypothetical protein